MTNQEIHAWRVRVDLGAYDELTSWSTNYDIIHGVMGEKYGAMPGADVRLEKLTVDLSTPDPTHEVSDITDDFPQWTDLDTTDLTCSTNKCENDPVHRRNGFLYCRPCADREFDNMPWQREASGDMGVCSE